MPSVNIDGQEYDLDTMSEDAKKQLAMVQFVDRKISDLQGELAVHNAARSFYGKNLAVLLKETKVEEALEQVKVSDETPDA